MQFMRSVCGMVLAASLVAGNERFNVSPSRIQHGKTTTILISDRDCKSKDDPLATATLRDSQTTGIKLERQTTDKCSLMVGVKVEPDAPYGVTPLSLYDPGKTDKDFAILSIEVVGVLPGPTPEGIREVDVMWKVLPYRTVADSFGKRVAQKYFYVEVTLGNNSGYPLLLESVGFLAGRNSQKDVPWPNDSYPLARSTIEKEQQVGTRALVLNSVSAAFSVAAASSGFVRTTSAKADYGLILGLAAPIAAGLDLVWPDKTVRHMLAMDSRAFRGGMVVQNNASRSFSVFISREVIECGFKDKGDCKSCQTGTGSNQGKGNNAAGGDKNGSDGRTVCYKKDFDPKAIFEALKPLVIVGNQIEFKQRMRVASNELPANRPTAPIIMPPSREARTLTAGAEAKQILLVGSGLTDVTVAVDSGAGIRLENQSSDPSGQFLRLTMSAVKDAKPGCHSIVVASPVPPPATLEVCIEAAKPPTPETPKSKTADPKSETTKPEPDKPEPPKPETPKPGEAKIEK